MPEGETTPMFDAQQQEEIAEFWKVFVRVQEDVTQATVADLADDPALGELIQIEGAPEQSASTLSLADRGVREGDWEPFVERMERMGRTYAGQGVAFADWFRLTHALRPHVVPHVIAAHRDDPQTLAAAIRGMETYFDLGLRTIGEAYLASREDRITRQQQAIFELSTPVLTIRPGLLLLPIVGVIDTHRSRQLTEELLHAVREQRAHVVVMDITGVAEVDSEVANRLVQAAEATRLMGATPVLTGISSGVAQTMVALGVDLKGLATVGDLQGGMERADEILGIRLVWDRPTEEA